MPDARHQIPVSEFETLRYRTDNHVAHITLDRPEKRNALNIRAYRELGSAFAAIAADEGVRAVVLTGADPGFCSGDDVGAIMAGEELGEILSGLNAPRPRPTPEAVAVLECDRPVIAAVNGPACGLGHGIGAIRRYPHRLGPGAVRGTFRAAGPCVRLWGRIYAPAGPGGARKKPPSFFSPAMWWMRKKRCASGSYPA